MSIRLRIYIFGNFAHEVQKWYIDPPSVGPDKNHLQEILVFFIIYFFQLFLAAQEIGATLRKICLDTGVQMVRR